MVWNADDRRKGHERRVVERRRTMRYNVRTLLVVEGITWIDPEGSERRKHIRRRIDREGLAIKFAHYARP